MPASLSSSPRTQLLFWCVRCLHKKNVFIMLQSYLTQLFRGLQLFGEKEKEKERRDEVVSWAELPLEMWGEVGKRLVGRLDVVLFRAVCKQWRLSLPSPNRFPLHVPLPPDHADMPVHNVPYFITEVNIYSVDVGSETKPQQVLMEFEELYESSRINAFIPRGAQVDLETGRSDIYRGLRLSFVAKAYRLHMAVPYFYPFGKSDGERLEGEWRFIRCWRVSKIVLISSNADGIDHAIHAPTSDLSVVALLTSVGKLALLRLGGSRDPNWEWDTGFCTHVIYEIATYKGQLCAIDCTGRAFLMDYNSLHMTQVAAPLGVNQSELLSMRLFEAHGDMYLVIRLNMFADVKVYKLCMRPGKWLEVGDTGNQVLLRGAGYNVSIPRDVLSSNYGSWMMKYKELDDSELTHALGASLLLAQDHMDNHDESDGRANSYCFIGFRLKYIPWFIKHKASTASILSQYENSIGSTNYVHLLILAGLL